jgi:DNA-binding MarR family transcriptional regulator
MTQKSRAAAQFPPRMRRVAAALQSQGRHTVLFHQTVAERIGLNATDSRVLSYLGDAGSATAGELAEFTGLTTGAVTKIIDRLEQAGLLRRDRDPDDRRKVIVVHLPESQAQRELERVMAPFGKAVGKQLGRYSDDQLELIAEFAESSVELLRSATRRLAEGSGGTLASSGAAPHYKRRAAGPRPTS